MAGSVFVETLRRNWRQTLYWGIGFFSYAWMTMLILPDMQGLQQYVSLMNAMPSGVMQAFGLTDATVIATPEGFVAFSYFLYMMLVSAVYAVLAGMSFTINDEESGILDMVLGLPLPRWRLIAEKFVAYSLMLAVIIVIGHLGIVVGAWMSPNSEGIDLTRLFVVSLNMLPSAMLVMGLTAILGSIVRRRTTVAAIAGVFVVASFFLDTLGNTARSEVGTALRQLSFFRYYDAMGTVKNGLSWESILVLLVVTGILLIGSLVLLQRRDVAV